MIKAVKSKRDPRWKILKPVMDALLRCSIDGHKHARTVNFEEGAKIVAFSADAMGRVNELISAKGRK